MGAQTIYKAKHDQPHYLLTQYRIFPRMVVPRSANHVLKVLLLLSASVFSIFKMGSCFLKCLLPYPSILMHFCLIINSKINNRLGGNMRSLKSKRGWGWESLPQDTPGCTLLLSYNPICCPDASQITWTIMFHDFYKGNNTKC